MATKKDPLKLTEAFKRMTLNEIKRKNKQLDKTYGTKRKKK